MKDRLLGFIMALLMYVALERSASAAAMYKGPELETLPEAVQRTIREQAKGARLICIEEAFDDGETTFRVEMKKGGKERSFAVADGGILTQVQIFLDEAPADIQKAIHKQLGKGILVQIDKYLDGEELTYDVEMTRHGRDRAFTLDEDGALINQEVFLEELPATVQKSIRTHVGSGRLTEIFKVLEEGEVSYEIHMLRHRKSLSFSLDAKGKMINADVLLEDTPAPVQKTIRAKLGDAHLDGVELYVEKNTITYEVTFTEGDETDTFEVSGDGKLLDSDDSETADSRMSV